MDEYLEYFENYCEFMRKYNNSTDSLSMVTDYMKHLQQYTEAMLALDKIGEEEMTKEEEKLYLDTMNEINKMLIDLADE